MTMTKKSRNRMFSVLLLSSIIGSLLQTSLTTALPVIMKDFGITAASAQWMTSAYSLAMGIMVPATAFLLKRFPTKKLFLTGMGLYGIGLLFCAATPVYSAFLLGRVLQALGSGLLLSMTQVVILTVFPPEQRGTAMGIYGLAVGAAPVLAPTLTGIVIDRFDWHVIFWFCLAIVVLDLVFACFAMKDVLENEKQSFDLRSMLLSAIGFSGVVIGLGNLGLDSFFSLSIAVPLLIGAVALVAFSLRQLRMDSPFLELRTFQNKEFRLSVIISMLLYTVMISGSTLIPIYIQIVHGLSATSSGLIMLPGSLAMAIISPFAGKIYDKFGIRRLIVVGSAFMTISCLGISFVDEKTSVFYLAFFYVIRLIAISCIMMPVVTWGMSTLNSKYTSHGTALLTSLRTISGALGAAVFVALMTFVTNVTSDFANITANVAGINAAFIGITAVSIFQLVIVLLFVDRKKKSPQSGTCPVSTNQ